MESSSTPTSSPESSPSPTPAVMKVKKSRAQKSSPPKEKKSIRAPKEPKAPKPLKVKPAIEKSKPALKVKKSKSKSPKPAPVEPQAVKEEVLKVIALPDPHQALQNMLYKELCICSGVLLILTGVYGF